MPYPTTTHTHSYPTELVFQLQISMTAAARLPGLRIVRIVLKTLTQLGLEINSTAPNDLAPDDVAVIVQFFNTRVRVSSLPSPPQSDISIF